ncbi:MAG: DUF4184 family protein [Nocardioides sp.]
MPFTLAHPVAVLPLNRLGLPLSALAAGSMAPDLPVFLRLGESYWWTHSWPGVVLVDPLLALLVLAIWFGLLRDPLVDTAPAMVRERLAARASLPDRYWLLAIPASMVGAATHVVWDSFTHGGRWGVRHVEWLHTEHAGVLGNRWLRYGSGVLGLAVMASVVWVWFARRPRQPRPARLPALGSRTLAVAVAVACLVAARAWWQSLPFGLHTVAFNTVVDGSVALVAATAALSVLWHVANRMTAAPGS